ncbi:sugar ABC transporter substrate-binding protein [Cryptosporangium japonicum]|uniref:Sugar ABC transporter substrate-binding protein n=1 Tax=Cryptosporangium japonicum TaxID=80872 RepID=A0ABP3EHB9_9ACTN
MVTRRDLLRASGFGALALAAAPLIAACGDGGSGAGSSDLTLSYLGTADQQQVWNKLFAEFQRKNPDIKLKATGSPVDNWAAYFDKVSTQLAGGVRYDLIQVATEGMQLFASKGLLQPLDDLVSKNQAELDDFLADAHPNLPKWNKQYGSPDGKTYFLPGDFNTMCLWFNKEVFQQAGVEAPTNEWTWDDFLKAGRTIKQKTGAFLYPATAEYFIGVMPWLLTNGASTLSDDWKKATCDTPAAIEAAEFARQLVAEKLSPPPGGSFDRFTLATQGKLATFGGGRWPIVNIRQANAVEKFGIVAWPRKVKQGSPVGWNGIPVMKSSNKPEKAFEFLKFLISKEGDAFFAQLGGTIVPARKSVAESTAYLDNSPTGTENLYAALDYATVIPAPAKGNLIQRDIEDTWGQILAGNTKPADGMKKMQEKVAANV